MNYKYKLAEDTIGSDDIKALCGWLQQTPTPQLTKGPLTLEMEKEWAKWVGKKYGVFCNSGSSANLLAAYALQISNKLKNNKVIVCDVGWVTSVSPFMMFNYNIIMCGTDQQNFGIDLNKLEQLCKDHNPGTVIFVQPLGVLVDKERLLYLKMKYGFFLIEDACAALGSEYNDGIKAGNVGDLSTFSLFYAHQASTMEGGLVFTDNKDLYNILVSIRSHGWVRDLEQDVYDGSIKQNNVDDFNKPFTFIYPGFNLRATDLQAFIGLRQINKLDYFAQIRNRNHNLYSDLLFGKVVVQNKSNNKITSSISFAALAKDKEQRTKIVKALTENGVESRLYAAGALHKHKFWTDRYGTLFKDEMSDRIHDTGFFIPNHHCLNDNDVKFIADVVLGVL